MKARLALRMPRLYQNWPQAMLSLAIRQRRSFVVRLRHGVEFSLHSRSLDTHIVNEIWVDKIYTWSSSFAIRDGWVVLDLGGHKGIFAIFAAISARGVKVFTFEPSSENFALLSHNIQRNRLSNVHPFNIAVGGSDRESILHLYREGGQNTLLQRSNPRLQPVADVKVETWSLGRVLRTVDLPVNLLKMDIEGMEYEALFLCPAEDLQKVERIALEYHEGIVRTPHSTSELVEFLNRRGFATHLQPGREILLAERIYGKAIPAMTHPGRDQAA
jgi:FkbM family methyltransferase